MKAIDYKRSSARILAALVLVPALFACRTTVIGDPTVSIYQAGVFEARIDGRLLHWFARGEPTSSSEISDCSTTTVVCARVGPVPLAVDSNAFGKRRAYSAGGVRYETWCLQETEELPCFVGIIRFVDQASPPVVRPGFMLYSTAQGVLGWGFVLDESTEGRGAVFFSHRSGPSLLGHEWQEQRSLLSD